MRGHREHGWPDDVVWSAYALALVPIFQTQADFKGYHCKRRLKDIAATFSKCLRIMLLNASFHGDGEVDDGEINREHLTAEYRHILLTVIPRG